MERASYKLTIKETLILYDQIPENLEKKEI